MSRAGGSAILLCEVIRGCTARVGWICKSLLSSQQKNKPGNIQSKTQHTVQQDSWTKRAGKETLPHHTA